MTKPDGISSEIVPDQKLYANSGIDISMDTDNRWLISSYLLAPNTNSGSKSGAVLPLVARHPTTGKSREAAISWK